MSTLSKFYKIILSYKWGLMLYFVIFGGLAVGMTFLMGDTDDVEFERLTNVNVAVFDRDETALTEEFIEFLTDVHNVIELEDIGDAWVDAVTFSAVQLVIEIPAGFTDAFGTDGQLPLEFLRNPQHTHGFLLGSQVESYFSILTTYLAGGFEINVASALTQETLFSGAEIEIFASESDDFAEVYMYFRFLPVPIIMVVTIAIGGIFMALNKQDVNRRIESAPVSYLRRSSERIIACVLFSLVGWLFFMAIPFVMYGVDEMLATDNLIRLLNSFPLVFLGIAFAFVITQFITKREMLMAMVFPIVFGLATPAGIFFDLSMMGEQILMVARFTPLYWYTRVNDMILFENVIDWNLVWQSLAIQIFFAIAILGVGLVFSKEKRARRG